MFDCPASARFCISSVMDGSRSFGGGLSPDLYGIVRATMALFLRAYDHGRRSWNWLLLVGCRAVLRLLRNAVGLRTFRATGGASCSWRHRLAAGDLGAF